MRAFSSSAAVGCIMILAGAGCSKPQAFKPARPLPPGTLMFHFTAKVEGPVDLTIDGVRIPVARHKKKVRNLVVSGLPVGRHTYFISSPRDAFGPDRGEADLPADHGIFLVNFAQHYDAVLYGTVDTLPPAPGLPGVTAQMEP